MIENKENKENKEKEVSVTDLKAMIYDILLEKQILNENQMKIEQMIIKKQNKQ